MNKIFKSYDVNSMISKTFESINEWQRLFSMVVFLYVQNFKDKFSLKLVLCNICIMIIMVLKWRTPKLLDRINFESKGEAIGGERVGAHSLARNTLGVEGCVGALEWTRKIDKQFNYSLRLAQTKQQVG